MKISRAWLWLLLIPPIVLGACRLRFDIDVLNLLPHDIPVVHGLQLYQQHFANSRELILTLEGSDPEMIEAGARLIARNLQNASNLVHTVLWQPAWMERPSEAAELLAYLWFNQPPETFGELTNRLSLATVSVSLAAARDQLATSMSPQELALRGYDPLHLLDLPETISAGTSSPFGEGQDFFVSSDGKFRILFVQAGRDLANYKQASAWLSEVKQVIERLQQSNELPAQLRIGYTGAPAFVSEIAGGMERDMTESVLLTAVIIAILFWLAHRRILPMLWLLTLLALILGATLALGGLLFGAINVVSLGFAAILLGLAVDYGVVHYQEAMVSPNATIPEIRRAIGPSILWAAVTTISAFLVLNFGGLPGLGQLGSLVAVGVALSMIVMLFAFLPPLFRNRTGRLAAPATKHEEVSSPLVFGRRAVFTLTGLILAAAITILITGAPILDRSPNALRPRNSNAYAALDKIKAMLARGQEPLWIITKGKDISDIGNRLDRAAPLLANAVSNHLIASFTMPALLWPRPAFQAANRGIAKRVIDQEDALRSAVLAAGFVTNSFALAEGIFSTWRSAISSTNVYWPTNQTSRWLFEKMIARDGGEFVVLGFVFPNPGATVTPEAASVWADPLAAQGFLLSGWELLGSAILKRVQGNFWWVAIPMVLLVLTTLFFAFRRPTEICLSILVMTLSALCLLATMRVVGWSWNLLNLMAVPLMLGSGVDYSIFMQLALRRHAGNLAAAYRSVGRALLLCGATAVAGFGSLSLSTNAGMASLGAVCAVGIGCNMLISVYLLPAWWKAIHDQSA